MKPKIFLSHSSKDKPFIVQLSNQLRIARIDCWYDDWEIPPGESIRRKIFEEGIPNCDLFFVYLSANSVESYWVQKELDSMITVEAEVNDSLLIPFTDSVETRNRLSLDLRSRNIPVINEKDFFDPVIRLTARTWEVFNKKKLFRQKQSFETSQLQMKNQLLEAENKILQLQLTGNTDLETVVKKLKTVSYKFGNVEKTLEDIFNFSTLKLAAGILSYNLVEHVSCLFNFVYDDWGTNKDFEAQTSFNRQVYEIFGLLIVLGLVNRVHGNEHVGEEYHLTSLGIRLANQNLR